MAHGTGGPMLALELPSVEELRIALAERRHVVLRELIPRRTLQVLKLSTEGLAARRVICGIPNVSWGEQTLLPGHPLHRLFVRADLTRTIAESIGLASFAASVQCWTSCYALGEYINEHTDVTGAIQLLLCLEAPPPECGGSLRFGPGGAEGRVNLQPGDALLFVATQIVHATEPLVASPAVPEPRRTVAVARYFAPSA